jgi:CRP/FNR family cyclic AMP-dependent transcriptional regulator
MTISVPQAQPVASMDLFRGMDGERVRAIEPLIRSRTFKAGHTVVSHQDDSHDVFFILAGRLRVTIYSDRGREIAFRDLDAGQSFGELAAIDGKPRSANVIALTDAVVGHMTAAEFRDTLRHSPEVAEAALRKLAALVRALSQRVEEATLAVPVRICHELLRVAHGHMIGPKVARIMPAPKHAEIASRVGTHREAVSRVISELTRRGILRKGHGEMLVTDTTALEAYARQIELD